MAEMVNTEETSLQKKSAWAEGRPQKDANYYKALKYKYNDYIKGNVLLTISEAINAVKTRTISLLKTNMGTQRLIGVCREYERSLKKPPYWTKNSNKD